MLGNVFANILYATGNLTIPPTLVPRPRERVCEGGHITRAGAQYRTAGNSDTPSFRLKFGPDVYLPTEFPQ